MGYQSTEGKIRVISYTIFANDVIKLHFRNEKSYVLLVGEWEVNEFILVVL